MRRRTQTLTITDDDDAGVTVTPKMLTIDEGATGTYAVVLTSAPTGGEVTITPSSNNPKVECRPVALTFTRADWNTAQTFLVTAYEDQRRGRRQRDGHAYGGGRGL